MDDPPERMKMRRPHRVPLSRQALAVLKNAHSISGDAELILPGLRGRGRSLSENTFNAALRRLGYTKDEMTAHGFRAAASSMLNESGKWNADAIEAQLAHVEGNLFGELMRGRSFGRSGSSSWRGGRTAGRVAERGRGRSYFGGATTRLTQLW